MTKLVFCHQGQEAEQETPYNSRQTDRQTADEKAVEKAPDCAKVQFAHLSRGPAQSASSHCRTKFSQLH